MNLIIVEDDNMTRMNLELLLKGEHGVGVVQAYESSEEAIASASWNEADIMLVDLDLPGMSGVELISWAQLNHKLVSCMAYTISEDRETVFAAIKAGACGYILKGTSPRELVEALHELFRGGAPMTPKIARKVIADFHDQDAVENRFTAREQDILDCIEGGLSYKDVASKLNISPNTVHTHIKNIYEKVQADDRDEALRKARKLGWG
jgi:two-component system NarL family response regulator